MSATPQTFSDGKPYGHAWPLRTSVLLDRRRELGHMTQTDDIEAETAWINQQLRICRCGDYAHEHDANGCRVCRQHQRRQLFSVCSQFRECQ